jgi:hypothetical protein
MRAPGPHRQAGTQGHVRTEGGGLILRCKRDFRLSTKTARPKPISGGYETRFVPQPVVIHDAISQFQISDTKPQTPDLAGIKCQLSTNEANPEKGVRTLQHQVII